jgi:hypothetical protein
VICLGSIIPVPNEDDTRLFAQHRGSTTARATAKFVEEAINNNTVNSQASCYVSRVGVQFERGKWKLWSRGAYS